MRAGRRCELEETSHCSHDVYCNRTHAHTPAMQTRNLSLQIHDELQAEVEQVQLLISAVQESLVSLSEM
jgi:hypothetical protein